MTEKRERASTGRPGRSGSEAARDKQGRSSTRRALEAALEAARHREEDLAALLASARAVLEREEFPEVARSVFDLCKNLLGATSGYVALLSLDGAENEVLFLDAGGLPCDVDPALPMPIRGLRAEAYRTAKAVYDNDFSAGPWVGFLPGGHARLENVLFAPLNLGSRTVGLLGLANKPGGFTEHDARMASAFAEIAAIALMNSRTFEALRGSEARYRALTQSAADAVISTDAAGNVVSWNRAAEEMFGRAQREMLGKPLAVIVPPRFWSAHAEAMRRVVSIGESKLLGTMVETVAQKAGGGEFPVELSLSAWETQEGRFFTGILRDITERKRAEQELAAAKEAAEAASRAKSQFLANMSHEIRTPMTAILGFTDLLMAYDAPASERRGHLQTIHRNAQNLLTLINDILDLSKIEADQVELEPVDCPPQAVVEEVRSLMQLRAHEKSLGLDVTYEPPLPPAIRTDATRLRQVLVNLVGNAIKFTPRGRVGITVRSVPADDGPARIRFEVSDTGIGMTAEEQGRLFRPFTQADMSHARRFAGTGLGLSISQKLAGLLGGRIDAQSEPGQGSTFTLTIPCGPAGVGTAPAPAGPAAAGPAAATAGPHRVRLQGRVLLAEDDPDVRALLSRILTASGLQVDTAEDGRIAWEKATSSKAAGKAYDVILMDCQMPELDGYEASRRLRREGWGGPIVALTAHAMAGDREKCLEAGCDDYLSKPMSSEALLGKMARHLGQAWLKYPSASSMP